MEPSIKPGTATQEDKDRWNGLPVVYIDPVRNEHIALINQVWSVDEEGVPNYINLVYVSELDNKTDQYGQQIERETSVVRESDVTSAGRCFKVRTSMLP